MTLYNISYCDDFAIEYEILLFSQTVPSDKELQKILNMYHKYNRILTEDEYKEFITEPQIFHIESIEEMSYLTYNEK